MGVMGLGGEAVSLGPGRAGPGQRGRGAGTWLCTAGWMSSEMVTLPCCSRRLTSLEQQMFTELSTCPRLYSTKERLSMTSGPPCPPRSRLASFLASITFLGSRSPAMVGSGQWGGVSPEVSRGCSDGLVWPRVQSDRAWRQTCRERQTVSSFASSPGRVPGQLPRWGRPQQGQCVIPGLRTSGPYLSRVNQHPSGSSASQAPNSSGERIGVCDTWSWKSVSVLAWARPGHRASLSAARSKASGGQREGAQGSDWAGGQDEA